jgi:hypothetical protein
MFKGHAALHIEQRQRRASAAWSLRKNIAPVPGNGRAIFCERPGTAGQGRQHQRAAALHSYAMLAKGKAGYRQGFLIMV